MYNELQCKNFFIAVRQQDWRDNKMSKYLNQIYTIKSDVQQLLIMASQAKQQIKWLKALEASSPDELQQKQEQLERLFGCLRHIQDMIESFEHTLIRSS
jgi:chromosome segregation ATPase